jgi:predicted nucleic acid-binding protein
MQKIFIDANIYLNFFDSNKPELKKLLDSLLDIKDSLFIGAQIVNEVNRNKLAVAQRSLNNHFNSLSNINPINLPEHLEVQSTNLQKWNSQSKEIHLGYKSLQQELEFLIHKTLEEIMQSADKVSRTFNLIFKDAIEASECEIIAARYRKEIGNPPGKFDDPLGDQISWEQFLNHSNSSEKIWIITKDQDYYTFFRNKRYLNSFLYNELVANNLAIPIVFCFESLAEGLKHFNENSLEKIENLPTEDELKIITEEELADSIKIPQFFPITEQRELKYTYLPPGFRSPNHYINYLKAYDSEDIQ